LKIDNKIDLDYFLAHKNLFNFKYVFLLHTMKSGKSLQLMKEFMCWQIWSHSDEKIWEDVQSSCKMRTRSNTTTIAQLLYDSTLLSFDVQRTLSISRPVLSLMAVFLSELGQGWHQLNFAFASLCEMCCGQWYFVDIFYFFKQIAKMHFFCGQSCPREISNNISSWFKKRIHYNLETCRFFRKCDSKIILFF